MVAVIFVGRFAALKIAGLPLLDRLILAAAAAGCRRVFLAGPKAESALGELQARTRTMIAVEALRAPGDTANERIAPLTGEHRLLVLHSELVLDTRYLRAFLDYANSASTTGTVLAIAEGPAPSHAFAVEAPHGRNAAHTIGLALVPATAGKDLEIGFEGFRSVLSSPLQQSDAGAPAIFRGTRGYASLLLQEADRPPKEWALIRAAGKETDGLISRMINRRVSNAATFLLLKTQIAPNTITLILFALGIITGVILIEGSHFAVVVGAFLYQANSMLDGCDGEIARLRFETSPFGAWADTFTDQVASYTFCVALPFGLYRRTGDTLYLAASAFIALGIAAALIAVYVRSRRAGGDAPFTNYGPSILGALPPRSVRARIVSAISVLLRRDAYIFIFFLLALAGLDEVIAVIIVGILLMHLLSLLLPIRVRPT